MPTYEYRCPKGHEFEHFFRTISAAESQMKCPECGELAERLHVRRYRPALQGSGFYITDYGKDGKKDQRQAATDSSKGGVERLGRRQRSAGSRATKRLQVDSDKPSKPTRQALEGFGFG